MLWKQFLTPVENLEPEETRQYVADHGEDEFVLLDVRQPNEYQEGHMAGAKLLPLPDLTQRLKELDPEVPALVYCATGGRSRVAAQLLSGKGFTKVYNVKGGYKAWQGRKAVGVEDVGLELFTGLEDPRQVLAVAYGLEMGLRDFYLSMVGKVDSRAVRDLFSKLAEIEVAHQDRVFEEYARLDPGADRASFESTVVAPAMEGGLSSEQYVAMVHPDWESARDAAALAMTIEAQALDLYSRAADKAGQGESGDALRRIAAEEKEHLARLGKLIEELG